MHCDDYIDLNSDDLKKPEIITFYNVTKGGVDVADRLKSEYSVTRISNRWPVTIFCSLLNIGAINYKKFIKRIRMIYLPEENTLQIYAKY